MRRSGCVLILSAVVIVHAAARTDDAPKPSMLPSMGVEVGAIDVVVTDRDGRPRAGMTPEGFAVLEDGERQQVVEFDAFARHSAAADFPTTPPAAGGTPAPPAERRATQEPDSIEELVRAYRSGSYDRAVSRTVAWSDERVTQEIRRLLGDAPRKRNEKRDEQVARSLDVSGVAPGGWTNASATERASWRRAAALMVAERAVSLLGDGHPRPLAPGLAAASLLLGEDRSAADARSFAQGFSLLSGLLLHWHVELAAGHRLLASALRESPDDPELHTALGSMLETVASFRTYEAPGDPRAPASFGGYRSEGGEQAGVLPDANLGAAEGHYERALALDPGLHEARLRLGHVRLLQGRPGDALVDLERVASETRQPRQRYLARLFVGAARQRQNDVHGAVAAYRACIAGGPRAQTALLALGRVLDSVGDSAGAQDAFTTATAAGRPFDPWWSYRFGQPERVDDLVTQLRGLIH